VQLGLHGGTVVARLLNPRIDAGRGGMDNGD